MARLLTQPSGVYTRNIEFLSGPRAVGAGSNETTTGRVQTYASGYGAIRIKFDFQPMRGRIFREYRGWVMALHGGANATRWTFLDPDQLTFGEIGIDVSQSELDAGMPWGDTGLPWSNGQNWTIGIPDVATASASKGATIIHLDAALWGHLLGMGVALGFTNHFGAYWVTEVIVPGSYRIWPPLRANVVSGVDMATLSPTLALRLESEEAASVSRGLVVADRLSATFVEVPHEYLATYFAD